jgi:hypothetical protein
MLDLNITIVSVSCIRVIDSLNAIKKSMEGINFSESKLITSENIEDSTVEIYKIPNLDYEGYNKFIVYELYKYIDTEYCLIVQDDGYVINPDKWMPNFLDYDYIGAPWALPNDDFSCKDPFGNLIRVGNGGFSLRSRKLLSLPTKLNLEWKSYFGYYNEDGFFTCHNRHLFEAEGCVYAPLDVSKYFSHEAEIPEIQGIIPFGFHGKWSKYYKK